MKKVVKRIGIINKAGKYFNISLKDNIDLSIFIQKKHDEEQFVKFKAGKCTRKEVIEFLIKYLNYDLMFEETQQRDISEICKQLKRDLLLQNQILTNLEMQL